MTTDTFQWISLLLLLIILVVLLVGVWRGRV